MQADAVVAGTVIVRDMVSRRAVVHFRAHTSPLAALEFSPGGGLLATASVHGHNIHVFRIIPAAAAGSSGWTAGGGSGSVSGSPAGTAVHLYCLHRGMTAASIRGICFAPDASWLAVSSGRGTTHLFHTPSAASGTPWVGAPAPGSAPAGSAAAGGSGRSKGGVVGKAERLLAVGRARRLGMLSSSRVAGGVAGAATSAALSLYGQTAGEASAAHGVRVVRVACDLPALWAAAQALLGCAQLPGVCHRVNTTCPCLLHMVTMLQRPPRSRRLFCPSAVAAAQ